MLQTFTTDRIQTFRKGNDIPLHDHQIWIVQQGAAYLETLYPNGDQGILGILVKGMAFGLPMTQVDPFSAYALTDVTLQSCSMQDIQRSPEMLKEFYQQSLQRLRQSEAIIAMLGYRRIEDRVRQMLLLLAGQMGQTTDRGIRIPARLTHHFIANATGTTRVTVTRVIGDLQKEGWLMFDKSRCIVLTRTILAR
jgi:CRP-like cAMP-binding protein